MPLISCEELWRKTKTERHSWFCVTILILSSVVIIMMMTSCGSRSSDQEILATKIQYDVPVVNDDPQLDWWINNLEGSKREPFLKRMMEAAEKGELQVFDYFNNPLTPEEVISAGRDTVYLTLPRDVPPYEEFDTSIISTVTYKDISRIRFLEEWRYDPATLQIDKKVVAIGPVILKESGGQTYNQLLFWIYTDDSYKPE